jgi:hypothetical protein
VSNLIEAVKESLEKFNNSIKADMSSKGMDTTFTASNSLSVSESGYILSSTGIDYIQYLNRGRPPGKYPPLRVIERWVDLKGLRVDPFVVARSIAENGSRIYRNRELGLKLEDKAFILQQEINKKIPEFLSNLIIVEINNSFK